MCIYAHYYVSMQACITARQGGPPLVSLEWQLAFENYACLTAKYLIHSHYNSLIRAHRLHLYIRDRLREYDDRSDLMITWILAVEGN